MVDRERIELRELRIPMGFAHQFFVRYDSSGNVCGEIHGLPTDSEGNPLAYVISLSAVPLGAVVYPRKSKSIGSVLSGYWNIHQDSMVVFEGDENAVEIRWKAAVKAADFINRGNFIYKAFPDMKNNSEGNCNSVTRTVGDCMGVVPQSISGRALPGQEKNLLPKHAYPELYISGILDESSYRLQLAPKANSCVVS